MSEEIENERVTISRRAFAGLGAAAGAAAAVAALPGVPAAFAGTRSAALVSAEATPSALGAVDPALTYLPLDALPSRPTRRSTAGAMAACTRTSPECSRSPRPGE